VAIDAARGRPSAYIDPEVKGQGHRVIKCQLGGPWAWVCNLHVDMTAHFYCAMLC